jgi:sugar/nucleoside kinase (ribokinase family)
MTSKTPFLTVYGHITVDQIVSVEHFPGLNETVDITSKKTTLGGTGSNIALTAARLGVPTALAGFIGADFPGSYLQMMEDAGMIMDEVVTVEGYDSSQCTVINDAGLKQKVIFYQGPQGFATKIGRELLDNAKKSKFAHFCTGEPAYYAGLMKKLHGTGTKVSFDPAQETYRLWQKDLLDKAVPYVDNLFCNDFEAKVLTERLGLKDILDLDRSLVVCTYGADGSRARTEDSIIDIPCVKGKEVVDATGCGDSYRAGYYAGLYYGYSVRDSLILASTVASFTIEKVGALTNTPTWDEVVERAKPYLE